MENIMKLAQVHNALTGKIMTLAQVRNTFMGKNMGCAQVRNAFTGENIGCINILNTFTGKIIGCVDVLTAFTGKIMGCVDVLTAFTGKILEMWKFSVHSVEELVSKFKKHTDYFTAVSFSFFSYTFVTALGRCQPACVFKKLINQLNTKQL